MQEKSLIKRNILQFIDYKGISKYKFYQKTGITRGVLDQNNGMSEENTSRFIAYYSEVNIGWLLTGKGGMLKKEYQNGDKEETKSKENVTISNGNKNGNKNSNKRNVKKMLPFQEKEPSPPDHSCDEIMQLLKENKKLVEEKNKLLENENERLNKEVSKLTNQNKVLAAENKELAAQNANLQSKNKELNIQLNISQAECNTLKKQAQEKVVV